MKTTTNFLSKDITIFDDVFDVTDLNAIIEDVADKDYRVGEVDFIGAVPSGVVCDLSDSITEKLLAVSNEAPLTGNHNQGDIVYDTNPVAGGYMGWVCVTSGAPGTWKRFGKIEE